MLYPTSESLTGAWDLRKRYTLSACRTWMNEAVRCKILPVGTMIKVEGIEVKEGLDILRVKTMDDGRGWYLEPKFVGE
ncbi:MAG TPA: hypothetical protein DCR97_03135 [Deltaproteobacteria bacterium]|nr:hypothetical protein [Deltaproteobacteria bacterium]